MKGDQEYDVVVLGTGIAGLSVALAAHARGLRPLLIEKTDKLGGGTTNSYGLIWIGQNHLARAAGYEDSRDDVLSYMRFLAGGEAIEDNLIAYVDHAPNALKFFEFVRNSISPHARVSRSLLRRRAGSDGGGTKLGGRADFRL